MVTDQAAEEVVVGPLPHGNVPHVSYDDLLGHLRRTVQHHELAAPSATRGAQCVKPNFIMGMRVKQPTQHRNNSRTVVGEPVLKQKSRG